MNKVKQLLEEILEKQNLIKVTFSGIQKKVEKTYKKVEITPILLKNKLVYQFAYIFETNTTHSNLNEEEFRTEFTGLVADYFKQAVIFTGDNDIQLLINKKREVKIIKNKPTKKLTTIQSHNRKKNYIIEEGVSCDFLERLEVMDSKGIVFKSRYDKYRQINKYLEIIEGSIKNLDTSKKLKIIDFGSGKAYLTFALYWYFTQKLGLEVEMTGLDLKKDVIRFCNSVAKDLKYDNLVFHAGDIRGFEDYTDVDMVVTLHACDTATDDAIVKAINWNAKVMLMVPCCQHELFNQVENEIMSPMLKHGIVKEKMSSLVTDSLRGSLLESLGYDVELFEFIDTEHTPKNIVIRATNRTDFDEKAFAEYNTFKKFWNIDLYLERSLEENIKIARK